MPQTLVRETILLTPEEAAETLRIGRTAVYKLMASGDLASVTIGKSRRVPRSAVDEYIAHRLTIASRTPSAAA